MAAKPETLLGRLATYVPAELRDRSQWVLWCMEQRHGQATKVPYSPISGKRAKSTDPNTWSSFEQACQVYRQGVYAGLGFVFSVQDPYIGIDLDGCVEAGVIHAHILDLVRQLDSYSEFSHSGSGIHVIVRGRLPSAGRKSAAHRTELYEAGRFFVMTGDWLPDSPNLINDRQAVCTELHRRLFRRSDPTPAAGSDTPAVQAGSDDHSVLVRMLASTHGAEIEALWRGDIAAYHHDHSAADLALCNHLAFWTGGNLTQMDRLFRQSGLMREKWDRKARIGETYGEGTLARAIASMSQATTPVAGRFVGPTHVETDSTGRSDPSHEAWPDASAGEPLPQIVTNDRQLPAITAEAIAALVATNKRRAAQPLAYVRAGLLTRAVRDEQGEVTTQPLSEPSAKGLLARCAR